MEITSLEEVADALERIHDEGKEVLAKVCEAAGNHGLTPLSIPYVVVGILILYACRKKLTKSLLRDIIAKSPLIKPIEEVLFPKD